ncbi:hypothetical protein AREALGSMS7_02313 [Arenibacter algicola]|uniref:Uncharacterized protein n=1 Tax=Arenibacter algicola TaxID=616991 RepID=A0A221UXY8_9FLAO|nr:hypothetical protein AREALGSMS7_02313 [Arenibacter algicola]
MNERFNKMFNGSKKSVEHLIFGYTSTKYQ